MALPFQVAATLLLPFLQDYECSVQESGSRMSSLMILVMNSQFINGCHPIVSFTNAAFRMVGISAVTICRIWA
jgi:hypothetical protein